MGGRLVAMVTGEVAMVTGEGSCHGNRGGRGCHGDGGGGVVVTMVTGGLSW